MIKKSMMRFFKEFIPQPIWDSTRYWKLTLINRGYYAHNNLDKKLKKYINYNNGYFVELGANDGFTQSNTLYFERKKSWRGVLVEPALHHYLSCTRFRSKKGNSIYCNACVPFNYKNDYVDIEYADLMSVSKSLDNDTKDLDGYIAAGKRHLRSSQKNIRFGAVARTLNSILDESNAPLIIDLLSLDVEGAELAVLSGIDFNKYQFKYMLIESWSVENISEFLSSYGYMEIDKLSHHDYLFSKMET